MPAKLLFGAPVAEKIDEETGKIAGSLKLHGVFPRLAIVRVGEKPDDIYYENAACKKADSLGVLADKIAFPESISENTLLDKIKELSADDTVHGILLLRPLPKHIDGAKIAAAISPAKDIDGITPASLYGVFAGESVGYAPCTARACMEILDYYNIPAKGKNAAVIGRSLVVGRPVAMLLMQCNATVTVCHTKTENVSEITKNADIIVTSASKAKSLGRSFVSEKQTIIDVSMNVGEDGKMCGDADFEKVCDTVSAVTPVPGGVGSVTTAILINNTVKAAEKLIHK